ncbi:MAG: hypothetical protein ACO1OO_12965 [Flavisolibacter sp.]
MPIHIGQQIRKKADDLKISQADLGVKISRTKQTVGDIFKRKSIDTDLLLSICRALEFDFFALYYQEEPLKSLKGKIDEPILQELKETKSELIQKEKRISDLEKTINANEKVIRLLEKGNKKK